MTLEQLVRQKQNRLESVPSNLFGAVERAQSNSFSRILTLLNTLDTRGGKILLTSRNISIIESLGASMQEELMLSGYVEGVQSFVGQFPAEAELSKEIIRSTFGDFSDRELYQQITRQSQRRALLRLGDDAVNEVFTNVLKDQLEQSISNEATFGDTVELMRKTIQGDEETLGALDRHVKRVARDTYNVSDRELQAVVANDLGAVYCQYLGGGVDDTRAFCEERNGRYFHREEVAAWGAGESTQDLDYPKSGVWQGRNSSTNEATIFTLLGGYNCMHYLVWVDKSFVPESVINHAKSMGYENA